MRTAKTLIGLGGCQGWSESSLGAHSFCWFCHVTAHLQTAKTYINLWVFLSDWSSLSIWRSIGSLPIHGAPREERSDRTCGGCLISWSEPSATHHFVGLVPWLALIKQRMVGFLKISVQIKKLIHFQYQESSHTHTKHRYNTKFVSAWRNLGALATHWVHSKDWSDRVDAQADLSLRWTDTPYCWFCYAAAQNWSCNLYSISDSSQQPLRTWERL